MSGLITAPTLLPKHCSNDLVIVTRFGSYKFRSIDNNIIDYNAATKTGHALQLLSNRLSIPGKDLATEI